MSQFVRMYQWIGTIIGARALKIVRYLIAGGIAAATNLVVLFLLVHIGHMHYLPASILAFVLSISVSFTMQKFLTFQDRPTHDMRTQFARYLVVILANLALNTALIYLLVDTAGMWYMLAQAIATAVVAVTGYVGYTYFVFRDREHVSLPQ